MRRLFPYILIAALTSACAAKPVIVGQASWYGPGFAGRPTASGEPFRPSHRTAAHKTLPFGTVVKVTYPDTGRSVRVVINDRGPYAQTAADAYLTRCDAGPSRFRPGFAPGAADRTPAEWTTP